MIPATLFFGFLFGFFLQYSRVNRNDVIIGMAAMEDWTVARTMLLAIGIGIPLVGIFAHFGLASYHIKPRLLGGVVSGGILFGFGMALLGYCPGTLAVSAGQGSLDAWAGIFGGLGGGLVYTLLEEEIRPLLGPDLAKVSLSGIVDGRGVFSLGAFIIPGGLLILAVFFFAWKEGRLERRWIIGGLGLGLLDGLLFLKVTAGRPIGASTAFPYTADLLTGLTGNAYFEKIRGSGHWELIFLGGAFLAGLFFSVISGEFEIRLVHERWKKSLGGQPLLRLLAAQAGGFVLIFGARLAGGCTSGMILSGMMQLALSALVFSIIVFMAFFGTGKLLYGQK